MRMSVVLIAIVTSAWAVAEAQECLDLRSAITLALDRAPLVDAASEAINQAQSEEQIARSEWRPQLSAFARSAAGEGGLSDTQIENQAGIRVSQRLYDFGRGKRQVASSRLGRMQVEAEHRAVRAQEAYDITGYYIDVLQSRATVEALSVPVVYLSRRAEAQDALLRRGESTRSMAAEARSEAARAAAELTAATFEMDKAEAELTARLGNVAALCDELNISATLRALAIRPGSADEIADNLIRLNPILQAERAAVDRLDVEADLRRRARLPVIDLAATSAYAYDDFAQSWDVRSRIGVEVNVPLATGGRLSATSDEAKARASNQEYLLAEKVRLFRRDVLVAVAKVEAGQAEVRSRSEARLAAQAQFDAIETEFDLGARTLTDLVEARAKLDRAVVQDIKTRFRYMQDLAWLAALANRLID